MKPARINAKKYKQKKQNRNTSLSLYKQTKEKPSFRQFIIYEIRHPNIYQPKSSESCPSPNRLKLCR